MSARTTGTPTGVSSTTLGTTPVVALAVNTSRQFFQIVNNSTTVSTNTLAYTLDGTTPVVNGNGVTLNPGGNATYDTFCPVGAVTVVGSAASTAYNIYWF